ncbi:uncharacterized protein LOC143296987 isoform X2 [Babylonia areolata]|uniref:uncharacterized protein LOC143296987 isoform X2 n=1 Tax=Babylonia areolata TaxID=304850 RepID=UPI003FD014AE
MLKAGGKLVLCAFIFLQVTLWTPARAQRQPRGRGRGGVRAGERGGAGSTCAQCEERPDACRRLAGLYTVTVLRQGTYNPVVEIPAQACSLNVTELAPSSNYLAVRTGEGDNIVNSLWLVGRQATYRGAGTVFELKHGVTGCPGKCITALGPTNRRVIVQVFPKSKNPGIAYSFVLPKDVPFRPFDRAAPLKSPQPSSSSSSSSSSSESSQRERGAVEVAESRAEEGPSLSDGKGARQTSGSEPRGRERSQQARRGSVAAFGADREEEERRPAQPRSYQGSSYGSHTLGGRGQSYTHQYTDDDLEEDDDNNDDDDARRDPTAHARVGERNPGASSYVPGSASRRSGSGYEYPASGRDRSYSNSRARSSNFYRRAPYTNRRPSSPSSRRNQYPSVIPRQQQTPRIIPRQQQTPERYPSSSSYSSSSSVYSSNNNNNQIDQSRGFLTSASSANRGGLVDRTYSRSLQEPVVENRLQVFERPLNRRPALSIGTGAGGNEYEWTISGLSECSMTCGGGTQETEVVCVLTSSATQVAVTPENCHNALKPRVQRVACNNMPCPPGWVAGEWSECSATCGGGTQARRAECRQRFSAALDLSVSASHCPADAKPAVSQQCSNQPCSQWRVGDWAQCSAPCGGGERRRTVQCVDGQGVQIPAAYCSPDERPADTQPCNTQSCDSQWWHTHWSDECSADCGRGVTSRYVLCADSSGRAVSESSCVSHQRPQHSQPCESTAGCGTVWFTGPWSQCSDSCGPGFRSRQVICVRREGEKVKAVGEDQCPQSGKPPSQEECLNSVCDSQFYMTAWTQCSVTCGRGVRSREVRCLNVKTRQPSSSCDRAHAPHRQEDCLLSPCPVSRSHKDTLVQGGQQSQVTSGQEEGQGDNGRHSHDGDRDYAAEGESHQLLDSMFHNIDEKCKDTFWNCRIVVQARLCHYDYYRQVCCAACLKLK